MGKHWKILGMSLLALIGVFAINAGAAQAKWLLLVNSGMVTKAKLTGTSEGGYLLSESGKKIHCNGSKGTAEVETKGTLLGGTASVTFEGCTDEGFPDCEIHSAGQAVGTIVATGEGDAEMTESNQEEVWVNAKGKGGTFTNIEYLGEFCPIVETNESVSGEAKIIVLEALKDLKLHEIHIEGKNLKLGESSAELHMLSGGSPLKLILGSLTEAGGGTIAVHLCELPGAPLPKCP